MYSCIDKLTLIGWGGLIQLVMLGQIAILIISGPKKISKPGQTVNLKAKVAIFCQNTHLNTLRGRPEARAAARAAGMLGPPLCGPIKTVN
jgi:hypothetical protein